MKEQEYYNSSYGYVRIWSEIAEKPDYVIVRGGDYDELNVVRRDNLVKKEDSYSYKQQLARKAELESIVAEAEKNFDAIADKIIDEALKKLSSRMKLNIVFGKGGEASGIGLTIANEIEKMVKEDTPKTLKKKDIS